MQNNFHLSVYVFDNMQSPLCAGVDTLFECEHVDDEMGGKLICLKKLKRNVVRLQATIIPSSRLRCLGEWEKEKVFQPAAVMINFIYYRQRQMKTMRYDTTNKSTNDSRLNPPVVPKLQQPVHARTQNISTEENPPNCFPARESPSFSEMSIMTHLMVQVISVLLKRHTA